MGKSRCKTIHLLAGSERGVGWELKVDICSTSSNFGGRFFTYSRQRVYRANRRAEDRRWAEKTFPRSWLKQYERHHEWECGEILYFLTHKEHKRRKNSNMEIRWRLLWEDGCLDWEFYVANPFEEPRGTVWSMAIAYDTIDSLGDMEPVDIEEEERIMRSIPELVENGLRIRREEREEW
jgi:hypothetical protein